MKTLLEHITEQFMREESTAAQQAKQMGLVSKGWGRWADSRTGKVTHKTDGDRLVPVKSGEEEPAGVPASGDEPNLDQVVKHLKTAKTKTVTKKSIPQRKVSVKQTAAELGRHKGIIDIWDEAQLSTKEVRQFETELGIDVARAVSDPLSYLLVTGDDYSWAGDEEQQKSVIITSLKDQMYYWVREDGGGYGQRDMAYDVGKFQLAFSLDNKNMSDKEARRELQRSLDTPTTVSGELQKIVREGTKTISKEVRLATRESHSEWADKQDESYDTEVRGWQRNINREALQRIDKRIKSDPPPPIQTDLPVHRGMAMNGADLKEFLGQLGEGSEIELPIGAFSFDPSVAGEFADAQVSHDYRPNVTIGEDATHAVMLQVTGRDSSLNGLYMNGNHSRPKLSVDTGEYGEQQEVLLPSGGYTVESVETKDHDGRQFVVVNLTQEN